MRVLHQLFDNNRAWAAATRERDPDFFARLARQQSPEYLWIGCSDSRLPPNDITGLLPGEIFVHRNVGNVVLHTDFNCLSVMEYAVAVLRVKHIIVCGHYGCGGVQAALRNAEMGLIDNWLRHIRDVYRAHRRSLDAITDEAARWNRLCEMNVLAQVRNVCNTTVVQSAWKQGQSLSVHGWVYALQDGLLRDLGLCVTAPEELDAYYYRARDALLAGSS
ncbi:MAG: carbonate dehydratase [Candidatus Competibacterales bacterium]|nr:carbonate dehydratase [Candidatus Competibacterales bacterium]